MQKSNSVRWIVGGCVAVVVVTASVLLYMRANSDKDEPVGDSDGNGSNSSQTLEIGDVGKAVLDSQSHEEVLTELVKIKSNFQLSAALYAYLADVDDSEFVDKLGFVNMLRLSDSIERSAQRETIQTIILRRVATVNPDEALRWIANVPRVRRAPLLTGLFRQWTRESLTGAIVGLRSLSGTDRETALESILSECYDFEQSGLLLSVVELGLDERVEKHFATTRTLNLLDDPSVAWEAAVSDSIDDEQQLDLLKLVASKWKEEDGFDVLLHASAVFSDSDERKFLSDLIESVFGTQLEDTFAYIQGLSREARGELPNAVALVAARIDPELALREISAWADDPILLQLQQTVANTWAHTNPRSMLDKLELLPQVTRVDAMEIAFTHLAYVSPEEAVTYLDIAKRFLRSEILIAEIIAEQWSITDPEAALNWSLSYSDSNSQMREILLRSVLPNLVATDVQKALELSGDLRSTRIHLTQAPYDVVWELAQMGKIDEAIALLPQLEEHPRYFAISDLGEMLVRAGDPLTAIELGTDIPSLSAPLVGPASYFNSIFHEWATRDPQLLFDSLQTVTSPRLRSLAAQILLDRQESRPFLSETSIETIEALLADHPTTDNVYILELLLQEEAGEIDLDEMVMPKGWREELDRLVK